MKRSPVPVLACVIGAATLAAPMPAFANPGDEVMGIWALEMPALAIATVLLAFIAWVAKRRTLGVFTKILFWFLFWPWLFFGVLSIPSMIRYGEWLAIPFLLVFVLFNFAGWTARSRMPSFSDIRTARILRER